jgi:hypothetical protein
MSFEIRKAERTKQKIKILVGGVSGSGKTYSALQLASGMTDWERIVVIDTENGSAELYSHLGDYNVIPFDPPYSPERYIQAIEAAENWGAEVIIIDSITHEWDGRGGILDIKDKMNAKSDYMKWGELTPRHNRFLQKMIECKCHLLATVRSKSDYVLNADRNGKMVPEKVGMKSITREGAEYEFTLMFDLDLRHLASSSKDRTSLFMNRDEFTISSKTGKEIIDWCESGKEPLTSVPKPENTQPRERQSDEQRRDEKQDPAKDRKIGYVKELVSELKLTEEQKAIVKAHTTDIDKTIGIFEAVRDKVYSFRKDGLSVDEETMSAFIKEEIPAIEEAGEVNV